MRYNDFRHDPLSGCACSPDPFSAENAVSARNDLNPASGRYPFPALGHRSHGGTDMKLVGADMVAKEVGEHKVALLVYTDYNYSTYTTYYPTNIASVNLVMGCSKFFL